MKRMEPLWTVKDIAERYKCSMQCARNYIRKMNHMENPLSVYESDLRVWETSRMIVKRKLNVVDMYIPREREGEQ